MKEIVWSSESFLLTLQGTLEEGKRILKHVVVAAGDLARWRRAPPTSAAVSQSIMQGLCSRDASSFF